MSHLGLGRGFHRLNEIAAYRLSKGVSRLARGFVKRKDAKIWRPVVVQLDRRLGRERIVTRLAPYLIAALALGLSACSNPYDPVQRGLGGGVLGAASGAAIGAAAGGGPGAALGAAIVGATGIFGGVATTPPPPPGTYYGYPAYGYGYPGSGFPAYRYPAYGYSGYGQPGYGFPGHSGYPAYSAARGYGYPGDSG